MVTVTYGHGFFHDCDDTTNWTLALNGSTATRTTDNNDYSKMDITVFVADVTDTYDFTNVSSDVYTKFIARYKTSGSATAKIVLAFTVGTQTVLSETASSTFTTVEADITAAKTIDTIQLHACDGVGTVWYDFALIYKDEFSLPNIERMVFTPPPQYGLLPIPTKVAGYTQNLGSESATVGISCDLDTGTWTRTGDNTDGEVFLDIAHNSSSEACQWINTGEHQFKVTLEDPVFSWASDGNKASRTIDLLFREYKLGDGSDETVTERFGLDLT